jgi:hypothetical protein
VSDLVKAIQFLHASINCISENKITVTTSYLGFLGYNKMVVKACENLLGDVFIAFASHAL